MLLYVKGFFPRRTAFCCSDDNVPGRKRQSKLRQAASDRAGCHLSHLLHSCVHLVTAIAHCRLQQKNVQAEKKAV